MRFATDMLFIRIFIGCLLLIGGLGDAIRGISQVQHLGDPLVFPLDKLNQCGKVKSLGIHPSGKFLIVSSLRADVPWVGEKDKVPNLWMVPLPVGADSTWAVLPYGICSEAAELYPSWDKKGRHLYFLSWGLLWESTGGPIYRVRKGEKDWKQVKGLGGGITRFCQEEALEILDCSISPDAQECFITAQTPEAPKGDFFRAEKGLLGWKRPERMAISSLGADISLSTTLDGRRLYLASNRYEGAGKGDIYRLPVLPDGAIGPMEPLGDLVNTVADEHHFVEAPDGKHGYFIREGKVWCLCFDGCAGKKI
ncbi:MAG: hypothetical protein AAFV07_02130 [Bacteroidota bacterium]